MGRGGVQRDRVSFWAGGRKSGDGGGDDRTSVKASSTTKLHLKVVTAVNLMLYVHHRLNARLFLISCVQSVLCVMVLGRGVFRNGLVP